MLTIDNLTCRRGPRTVLRGVTASVPPGACLLVTGANGSGKSTLLRALAGLVAAGGGICWNGAAVADDMAAYRDQLHYIGHQDALKPELTAAEVLGYWRELQDGRERNSSLPLAGRVREGGVTGPSVSKVSAINSASLDISADRQEIAKPHPPLPNPPREGEGNSFGTDQFLHRPIRQLSAGQRRRLVLTRLLLTPRPLWLLDEPVTALDTAGQGLLLAAIARHRATGGIAIVATHDALPISDAQGLAL